MGEFQNAFSGGIFEPRGTQENGGLGWIRELKQRKAREMENASMNFESVMVARDSEFTELTMANENLTAQLRQQKDQIWFLQAEMCNIKVSEAA